MDVWWAYNSVKNWCNLPIRNPKPDLHNINGQEFGEYPMTFTQVIIYSSYQPEMKIQTYGGQITLSNIENLPISNPNQISTISMHIPSLVKIYWHLLKLLSGNENKDVWWVDNFVKNWQTLPISNPKPDLHNINEYTKFRANP